jgi:hypothetical protein
MAYVTALSRDREAAQQDLGTFVRVASMMTADSVMRKNFNQMLRVQRHPLRIGRLRGGSILFRVHGSCRDRRSDPATIA